MARANLATSYWSAGRTSDALKLREPARNNLAAFKTAGTGDANHEPRSDRQS
jgi:hypothetical protein